MSSRAFSRFETKLNDVQALLDIHRDITGSGRGKVKLRVLHKAAIALLVAAWETYIESLLEEGVLHVSGLALAGNQPDVQYPALQELIKENVQQATKRLHTAKSDNVLILFRNCFGMDDIRQCWGRRGMDWKRAYRALDQLLDERHSVVHGALHDPEYHRRDVELWRKFLRITVDRTDREVKNRIRSLTGKNPW
ncbi:MAG TPA: HEPN domain-containing protein [Candidatus Kapabacteria bacterium]|nr:HEPN domain-containing protein [Candidatus Kapabacteria bacterium]